MLLSYATELRECAVHVAAGHSFSAVVTQRGELLTWGYNDKGQLGHGDRHTRDEVPPALSSLLLLLPLCYAQSGREVAYSDARSTIGAEVGRQGGGRKLWRGEADRGVQAEVVRGLPPMASVSCGEQ
eukprot:1019999-Rhodomonas_salina.1